MNTAIGIIFVLFGIVLIATREFSAQFHERWNGQFRWTQWATGPKVMQASRVANVAIGIAFVGIGLALLVVAIVGWLP